jgi:hypothetical protein
MAKQSKRKPERTSPLLMVLVLILAGVPSAICWFFFFGIYGALGFAVFLAGLTTLSGLLAKRYRSKEPDSRIDRTINNANDDPREMARWVP